MISINYWLSLISSAYTPPKSRHKKQEAHHLPPPFCATQWGLSAYYQVKPPSQNHKFEPHPQKSLNLLLSIPAHQERHRWSPNLHASQPEKPYSAEDEKMTKPYQPKFNKTKPIFLSLRPKPGGES